MTDAPPVVALFGATALGKSDVALELAGLLDADIVVADSMQIYAGLPISPTSPARRRAGAPATTSSAGPRRRTSAASPSTPRWRTRPWTGCSRRAGR